MYKIKSVTINKPKLGFYNALSKTTQHKEWCVAKDGKVKAKCGSDKQFAELLAVLLNQAEKVVDGK